MILSDSETLSPVLFYFLCKYRFGHWGTQDIERYRNNKLRDIVNYAAGHSPFFRSLYRDHKLSDFHALPSVNKEIMMDNFSGYNTLCLEKAELENFALRVEQKRDFSSRYRNLNIGMSSGTSGNKGLIITTRREELYLKAMYFSRLVLPPRQKLNCAFILRVSSPAFAFGLFGHRLTYINQLQPIEQIISAISMLNPNVVSAPPSMLNLLADESASGRLKVRPALVYSYAEVLYPDVRDHITRVFGCPIHEIYQGSEGCYAMTCREGRLHINEDVVFLELFNRDCSRTMPGNPCFRLLVTDLHKHSQPVIRYELNDIITISPEPCPCGSQFRVIASVQGRADNLFWGLRNGSLRKQFVYPDYIARKIISISGQIRDYQVIQNGYTDITVRLLLNQGADISRISPMITAGIREIFRTYDCREPVVNVEIGEPVRNIRSQKLIRIICNIRDTNI
jgi:putative adenylate-forming enzyme